MNVNKIKANYQSVTKFSEFDFIYVSNKQWKFQGLEIILPEVVNKLWKCWNWIYGKMQQKILTCVSVVAEFSFLQTFWCIFKCKCRYNSSTICFIRNKRNCTCCRSWYNLLWWEGAMLLVGKLNLWIQPVFHQNFWLAVTN